jgi:glycosidase
MNASYPLSRILTGALAALLATGLFAGEATRDWPAVPAQKGPDWVGNSVIYEIFPRQFSQEGTFSAITARLDELKALGVDVLWLMPVHPIGHLKAKGTIGSPYAVRDYYAVNPDYGTKDDLHHLVDAAHARGMKVIIDIVANHTAWDSVMMSNPSFYKQDADGHVIPPHPDWADVAGLNYANPETRKYMIAMLEYWAGEFHLDGFRCDAAGEVPTSFWEEMRAELDKTHPGLFFLAESSKPELMVRAFDADYGWPMLQALNRVLMAGAPASQIRDTWENEERKAFPAGTVHMHMSDDHDEPRAIGRFGAQAALAASAMMFTLDGVPLLYNGMEVGDCAESGDPALFEKVPIFWQPKRADLFRAAYTALIALRHQHPALQAGTLVWLKNSEPGDVVSFLRRGNTEEVVTVVNFSNRPRAVSVTVGGAGEFVAALKSEGVAGEPNPGLPDLKLGAFGWCIFNRTLAR